MHAVFLDFATMGPGLDLVPLHTLFSNLELFDETTDDEVAARIEDVEFVFTNKIRLTDELLLQARQLRYIGLTATGTDNIDLETARASGIAVANIRAYCTQSIVEHVFGALLTLTHSLNRYTDLVRRGKWQEANEPCMLTYPIRELSAMTIGIVGYGSLGHGVARTARDFGMPVLVSARPGSESVPDGRVAFDELLERADIVSLHCPLTDQTRNLFDQPTIGRMRANAILINTARGGLVDSAALVEALSSGRLGGAAIDVLPQEPPTDGDPLLDYDGHNLIVTPHVAWGTGQARQNAIDELAANAAAFLAGGERNRVV